MPQRKEGLTRAGESLDNLPLFQQQAPAKPAAAAIAAPKPQRGGLVKVGELLPAIPAEYFDGVVDPKEIGYTHPVFVQCFLPTKHSTKNRDRWQVDCGRASLLIRSGELANPHKKNTFKKCVVPAGPKARFIVGYVNDQIQRSNSPTVDMGDSLRQAMKEMQIPICGSNGEALCREVENFAAAEINIGVWDENGPVEHHASRVAPYMRFWLEKDEGQRTLWQPEMTVSAEYFKAVREGDRLAPFYWPAMIALSHDVRAMDIHTFLVYRLRHGLRAPVQLHQKVLHSMFGQDITEQKKFWQRFKKSLAAARRWYPQAVIEEKNDCIILKNSPPLIPYRKVGRITGIA